MYIIDTFVYYVRSFVHTYSSPQSGSKIHFNGSNMQTRGLAYSSSYSSSP